MTSEPAFEETGARDARPGFDEDDAGDPADLLSVVVDINRLINRLQATRAVALDLARREADARVSSSESRIRSVGSGMLAQRAFRAEVASALTISERSAENLIGNAAALVSELPATLAALGDGTISYRHATIMVEQTACLDREAKAALEQAVIGRASGATPPKFARAARVARERLNPESIAARHEAARDERGVTIDDQPDGLSTLTVTLLAPSAHAIFTRLTSAAHNLRNSDDDRTLGQRSLNNRRADVFAAVMLSTAGGLPFAVIPDEGDSDEFTAWFRGITPQVVVSVPVLTLLGHSDEPGMLEGRVPIDPETARRLAGRAKSFIRILTHPETGATLSVGRRRYKVPKDLRAYLRIRDLTCRFPGCSTRAARCDIDHTLDWQFDGTTAHDNLAHLCRGHHTLKGATDWSVAQSPENPGVLTWRSPSGREHVTRPENPMGS